MKKILLTLLALVLAFAAEAKVVKITLADGSEVVISTSELSAIDFEDDGTVRISLLDGRKYYAGQDGISALLEELTIGDDEVVYEELDRTVAFNYNDKDYFTRGVHQINFLYPSTDPWGEPITLSGAIFIPQNIWEGEAASEGVLLFNHYTIFDANEAPTKGYFKLEGMFMANPLNPNYIFVESDFYGFGATVRFPQAYIQGDVNGRASCDALLAARRILTEMGIDYGSLTFNVGYSSGGFDALATQKARDNYYRDLISFDKTFAGGSPSDIRECYRQYVLIDSTAYNAVPPLLMVSTVATQHLDLTYEDVFQPFLAEKIDEWIMSKKYWSWPVCDSIGREKKIHEILTPDYCNLSSTPSRDIQDVFRRLSLNYDWDADPMQRIYLFHSRGDDYVPVQAARPLLSFLEGKGFQASVVPGKTNLQTNFLVRDMGHLKATLVYLVQSLAAIKAWPAMYTDGELNPTYVALIDHDATDIFQLLRTLEDAGVDVRGLIQQVIASLSEGDGEEPANEYLQYLQLMQKMQEICASIGLPLDELTEMLADSGFDLGTFFLEFIKYLNEQPAESQTMAVNGQSSMVNGQSARAARLLKALDSPADPAAQYARQFNEWLGWQGIAH